MIKLVKVGALTLLVSSLICGLVGLQGDDTTTSAGSSANPDAQSTFDFAGFSEAIIKPLIEQAETANDTSAPAGEHNTIVLKADTTGQEPFSTDQVKTINHHIYWTNPADVPAGSYFLEGYIKISFDQNIVQVTGVTSGLFSTGISSSGPGWVIVNPWYFFFGVPPVNDPAQLAFSITYKGKQTGITTFTYDITNSAGVHRGWFYTGTVHNMIQSPVRVEFLPLITPPNAPSNLVATAVSSSQINLTWQDNSDNEDGFIIELRLNNWGDFVQIATVGANTTSYSTTRVLTGIPHYYRVRAYNRAGNSDYSNIASATPPTPMDDIVFTLNKFYQEGAIKNQGLYNSLLVKLQAAQNAQNPNAALGQLNAFSNQVKAQSGKGITVEASQNLLTLNEILIAYTNPAKTASGTNLVATFKPIDYNSVTISAVQTPEPYEPVGGWDNRAYVGERTPGSLTLWYNDSTGQACNLNRNIEINNITKAISYNGGTITTISAVFGTLEPAPAGDFMCLLMDSPSLLDIMMAPIAQIQPQASQPRFKTDAQGPGNEIILWHRQEFLQSEADRISGVNNVPFTINGIPTTINTLITNGIITPMAITPTKTYNCHGWTFTCGSGWLNNPLDVERIISDNGYAPVTSTNWVHVGAIAVYRDISGTVMHTAIVREVLKADGNKSDTYCNLGTPTLLESKWGAWGRYKHPPETVPDDYLPPDDPNTPQNERSGGITYYQPPNRNAPVNTGDPGKDKNTLQKIQ